MKISYYISTGVKSRISLVVITIAFLGLWPLTCFEQNSYAANSVVRCSVCGKKIRPGNSFIRAGGKIFCSRRCYQKTLPKCVVCGRRSPSGFRQDGKFYCSKKCLSTTWRRCEGCGIRTPRGVVVNGEKFYCEKCAAKPRCSCCGYPGNCSTLADGRLICDKCLATAVSDRKTADKLFKVVKKKLRKELNLPIEQKVELSLVSIDALQQKSPHYSQGAELGLYVHEEKIEKTVTSRYDPFTGHSKSERSRKVWEKNHIYILYGLKRSKFMEVAAHELGHAWMQENFPQITDLKVKEGWAEYVAYLTNKLYKNAEQNRRMLRNEDPIYGNGLRMIKKIADKKGINGLIRVFRKQNNNTGD